VRRINNSYFEKFDITQTVCMQLHRDGGAAGREMCVMGCAESPSR
jgi:hypothetical protein